MSDRPASAFSSHLTERNNVTINNHPAWASEYDLLTNTFRPMDVLSNSFCAGGTVLGNGTWLNVGGNQAVSPGGIPSTGQTGQSPYANWDGGKAIRFLDPCDDMSCNWVDNPDMYMTSRRWYPTLETLEDGSAMILGGCEWGGYVNNDATRPNISDSSTQNNPTVEVSQSSSKRDKAHEASVLSIQGGAIYAQVPDQNASSQPLPPDMASTIRQYFPSSGVPNSHFRLQEQH
jgi:hypothetical protein